MRTLIDNSQLELVNLLLEGNFQQPKNKENRLGWEKKSRQAVAALLNLMDLVILNDYLCFLRNEWEETWHLKKNSLQLLLDKKILTYKIISKSTEENIKNALQLKLESNHQVDHGALYYLELSKLLKIPYWPEPSRAKQLKNMIQKPGIQKIEEILPSQIEKNLHMVVGTLLPTSFKFPGFGAITLLESTNRHDIFSVLMQYRDEKFCVEFRDWVGKINSALEAGDIETYMRIADNDIAKANKALKSQLNLSEYNGVNISVSTPLSIGISLSLDEIKDIWAVTSPKKGHVTFLIEHQRKILKNVHVLEKIRQLFPELSDVHEIYGDYS